MKPNVLFVTAELTPIAKVGGLADVAEALPKALNRANLAEARIILPYYAAVRAAGVQTTVILPKVFIPTASGKIPIRVLSAEISGNIVYLLESEEWFGRGEIYLIKEQQKDPFAEMRRFLFFTQAALHLIHALPNFRPDILHCHDWHTGMVPILARRLYGRKAPKTVFTIHNLAMQGRWNRDALLEHLGLSVHDARTFSVVDHKNDLSLIEQGILTSDVVNTVSRTYAKEILTPEYGAGIENILQRRSADLYGIVNGLDTDRFNPQTDAALTERYSEKTVLEAKQTNKTALQRQLGLTRDPAKPLFGFVGRLTDQKGMELINGAFPPLLKKRRAQLVVLGSGTPEIERRAAGLARAFPGYASTTTGFDAVLANRIYAGSDFFLMPSRFEPCGLGQLIALRYGSVPIVRTTGGLVDTVPNYEENPSRGLGFHFSNFTSAALGAVLEQVLTFFAAHPEEFNVLRKRGMEQNLSWDHSAPEYAKLYARALKK